MLHSGRLKPSLQTLELERLARDKHSSLLRKFDGCKKFYCTGPLVEIWTYSSEQDKIWAEFSTIDVAAREY